MSLWTKIRDTVTGAAAAVAPAVIGAVIPGAGPIAGAAIGSVTGSILNRKASQASTAAFLPALPAAVGTVGRVIGGVATAAGVGSAAYSMFGSGGGRKKYRHMDYGNARAAKRAIKRIKGTRKMLQDIEKQLPKVKSKGGACCPAPKSKKCA